MMADKRTELLSLPPLDHVDANRRWREGPLLNLDPIRLSRGGRTRSAPYKAPLISS